MAELLTNKTTTDSTDCKEATVKNILCFLEGDADDVVELVLDLQHFNKKEGTMFNIFFEN